jgi:putative pyridoxal-dependent aspartate 1-decarboxylase
MTPIGKVDRNTLRMPHSEESSSLAPTHLPMPLSSTQQGLWIIDRIDGGSAHYNLLYVYRLAGNLNILALRLALNSVLQRNGILRTVYRTDVDHEVTQQALSEIDLAIDVIDMSSSINAEVIEKAIKIRGAELATPFDLGADLMLRVKVLTQSPTQHVLFLTFHHIAVDRWSISLFNRQLAHCYEHYTANTAAIEFPPQKFDYADYAWWQKNLVDHPETKKKLDFWQTRLRDLPLSHNLPLDHKRPTLPSYRGRAHEQRLGKSLSFGLYALAKQYQVTLFMLFHAAFSALVSKYSGDADIVMGTPIANRNTAGLEDIIGFIANTLVLRADLSGDPRFEEILDNSRQYLLDACENQDVPFDLLIQALQPEHNPALSPLFQIMLVHQNNEQQALALAGLAVTPISLDVCAARFDLTLEINTDSDEILLRWEYATDLFHRKSIVRMAESFQLILNAVQQQPQLNLSALPVLTEEWRNTLLHDWNATAVPIDLECGAHSIFEQRVAENPQAIALLQGNAQQSYAELNTAANRLAAVLSSLDLPPASHVGIYLNHSFALVTSILAIWKAGYVYVPLDPDFPDQRLISIADDAHLQCVLSTGEINAQFRLPGIMVIELDAAEPHKTDELNPPRRVATIGADPAYIMYTSGSTGKPKGVIGLHRSLVNRTTWMQNAFPGDRHDVFSLKTSIGFVDHIAEIMQPLVAGLPLVVIDKKDILDADKFIDTLNRYAITRLTVVPSLLQTLLDTGRLQQVKALDLVISSGEILPGSMVREFQKKCPAVRLINLYGSTEIGADVAYHECAFNDDLEAVMRYFSPDAFRQINKTHLLETQEETHLDIKENFDFANTTIADTPISYESYLYGLHKYVVPNLVDVSSNLYIGHMTSALPNFLPELSTLVTRLNQNLVKIETSQAFTFLERQVVTQIHRLFFNFADAHYDEHVENAMHIFGIVTSGGTVANLLALWCARNTAIIKHGISKEQLVKMGAHRAVQQLGYSGAVILGTRLMHYSMKKSVALFGMGEDDMVFVDQDEALRMSPAALEQKIVECRESNKLIIAIVGIAGATETGTVDPLVDIAAIAARENIHFHVDAAWGGALRFSRKLSNLIKGVECADTITFCAHKQLYMPQGISLCLFKDRSAIHVMTTHAAYQASEGSFDFGQYTVEGSRPANVLYLHASLSIISRKGYAWLVERNMARTEYFTSLINQSECFELIGSPDMNIINYRYIPRRFRIGYQQEDNLEISRIVTQIQECQFRQGKTFVSKTKLLIKRIHPLPIDVFRVVLCNPLTSDEDLVVVLNDQIEIAMRFDETSGLLFEPESDRIEYDKRAYEAVPIGVPIFNTTLHIMDKNNNPLPPGVIGDLYVGGAGLAAGYLGMESLTAAAFVSTPAPFENSSGMVSRVFKTGDLARRRVDGKIEFMGRADQQIKLRGCRIELGEIETALSAHSEVIGAVAVVDMQKQAIYAYVVSAKENSQAMREDIQRSLRDTLPVYMQPAALHVVSALPLLPNGKVDKKKLQQLAQPTTGALYEMPQSPLEKTIAEQWKLVLGIDCVGMNSGFFDLGGHSLLMIKMIMRLRKEGIELSPQNVLSNMSIRELAGTVLQDITAQSLSQSEMVVNIHPAKPMNA